jgi:predicted nucleic acid-binding protein
VILLDTNYLIRGLVTGTTEAGSLNTWLAEGEDLCTSSIAWYEFVSGPVDEEGIDLIREVIQGRILPFVADTATEAARLFNASGRVRRLRVDAMIAATAIIASAALSTANVADFKSFTTEGLRLA